ncbi:Calcium-activated outward-rectifying potassium channel, putative [Ricinus communis]|uniref:Calcium-activated outward-rectifying potassium channel, putative n=1 Tax=Ricinus communis TaxID=3988 RepID=B9SA74_RICCO|nr:Calcium-activated outward-rectifying potassium channel, putative [Ricinus communis]
MDPKIGTLFGSWVKAEPLGNNYTGDCQIKAVNALLIFSGYWKSYLPFLGILMANDGSGDPLLSDMKDLSSNAYDKKTLQRRRFRQSINPHVLDVRYPEQDNSIQSLQWFESLLEKQKFSFKQVFISFAVYLGVGTLCFFFVMHQIDGKKTYGPLDAMYFSVVTMTTVGYGDLVPHSTLAKLLACVYVFIGMAFVGIILSKAADYLVEKQEILLVRVIHMREKIGSAEILNEAETHKVKYKFLFATTLLLVLILVGTAFLCVVENFGLVDAFYCVFSTISTLGYGDESFSTRSGRLFAVFWILSSTICLAQFFLYLTELYTETRQRMLVRRVLTRTMTSSDIESADLDHDKVVTPAEFILYTLKEMGKIEPEDILLVMERFKKLDVDHSGTLTEADLVQSQSS